MKFLFTFIIACTLSVMANEPGAQHPLKFKTKLHQEVVLDYLIYLPKGYSTSSKNKWPLMLFLHGAGERGTNVSKVAVHGPPKLVESNPDFPFILVSPQCPSNQRWERRSLIALLDSITKKYNVDSKRVYLTGLSMGGYGTWDLASSFPERFAAIVPICGGGQTIDVKLAAKEKRQAMATLGVWAFTGARDRVVPVDESQRMVDAFKAIGNNEAKLTVYPEADHDSWTVTYNNPEVFEWLLKHSR